MTPRGAAEDLRQASLELAGEFIKSAAGKERVAVFVAVGILLGQLERKTGPFNRTEMFELIAAAMDDQHTASH